MNIFYFVIKKFRNYLQGYIDYRRNGRDEFTVRKYQFPTLQYFESELGIYLKAAYELNS